MGSTFGRQVLEQWGVSTEVAADGNPEWKPGGVTIDWTTISALGADYTEDNGFFAPSGEKFLRYGQVVCRIVATAEVQTLTVTGTPTGGSVVIQGVRPDGGLTATGTIAYNSTAAQAQVVADAIFGTNSVTVGGGALPGTPLTFTFRGDWDPAQMTVTANNLTGGSTPAAAFTTGTPASANVGQWGPYDPAATDGRQLLNRGDCFVVSRSWRETDPHSNHPAVLEGGLLWRAKILMTAGTASLAAGPTIANFEAAFPRVRWARA